MRYADVVVIFGQLTPGADEVGHMILSRLALESAARRLLAHSLRRA